MAETLKHTPGPWHIGRGADGLPIIHTAPDTFSSSGQGVAHVCKRTMCQEHTANARLIAAAPEMYEALRALIERSDANDGDGLLVAFDAARAAIAKAEGR